MSPGVCDCYCESRGLMTVPTRRKPVIRYLPRFCHFHSSSKSLLCGGIGPRAALPLARHFLCYQATLNCKGMDPMLSFGPSKIPSRWPNRQSWPSSSRNPARPQRLLLAALGLNLALPLPGSQSLESNSAFWGHQFSHLGNRSDHCTSPRPQGGMRNKGVTRSAPRT